MVTMNCAVNSSEIGLLRSAIFSSTPQKYLSERGEGQENVSALTLSCSGI